jgi:hypothetical protein
MPGCRDDVVRKAALHAVRTVVQYSSSSTPCTYITLTAPIQRRAQKTRFFSPVFRIICSLVFRCFGTTLSKPSSLVLETLLGGITMFKVKALLFAILWARGDASSPLRPKDSSRQLNNEHFLSYEPITVVTDHVSRAYFVFSKCHHISLLLTQ